ncbi:hypothetical protein E1395_16575 [Salmonella enterica subsp. enterica serovar Moero]|nr:hypothetical protein [Salmonella enterica subsp. enterica serovar Moero]ECD5188232.1 hypothetical protein [Salmonella enterica subsp. enterica serovar Moero]
MVFSNNSSDTLNSPFSINSLWRIIIVQTLIKKGLFNVIFEHTPMILGANAHIYALPGLHKKFHNLR